LIINLKRIVVNFDEKKYLLHGKVLTTAIDYKFLDVKFKNKNILDVGAWIGDSILLFHKLGAKKIIAYEPIKENVKFAKKIIKKFGINCKIYNYAVYKRNENKEFLIKGEKYGKQDLSLLDSENAIHREAIPIKVKCISWEKVLEKALKEKIEIAKVDCEGCEKYLIEIDVNKLSRIPIWIIESNDKNFVKSIYIKIKKFNENVRIKIVKTISGYFLITILF